jgi:hypothetical protein
MLDSKIESEVASGLRSRANRLSGTKRFQTAHRLRGALFSLKLKHHTESGRQSLGKSSDERKIRGAGIEISAGP